MFDLESWKWGFLILARMTAFFTQVPFFSISGVPKLVKVGLGVLVTLILIPVIPVADHLPGDLPQYAILVIKEVIVGLVLGFAGTLTFTAIRVAGEVIDINIGFSMASIFDVQDQSRITLLGQFMYLFGIMLFLAINGHHSLLMAIASSYKLIPVTGAVFSTACPEAVIKMFVSMFALGVKIAAPFITVFVLSDIALGMIARTVPQLNVFMLGFPMKIGLGLVTLLTALPILIVVIGAILKQIEKDLLLIMKIIS